MTRQLSYQLIGILLITVSAFILSTDAYFIAPAVPLGVIGLYVLYKHPEWGLIALAGLVPFESLFAGSKFLTGPKIIGTALLIIVTLKLLLREIPLDRLKSLLWWPIVFLILAFFVSTLLHGFTEFSLKTNRQLLTAISIFYLTLALHDRISLVWLMRVLALSVAITATWTLISTGSNSDTRAIGLLTDPNYFALLLITVLPLTLYLVLFEKTTAWRILWFLVLVALMVAFVKTSSRSGLVVLVLAFSALAFHYRAKLRFINTAQLGLGVITLCLLATLTLALLPQDYRDRMLSLVNIKSGLKSSFEDRSLGRRASYLVVGLNLFKQNPVFGAGPGSFPEKYSVSGYATAFSLSKEEPELFRRAHNTYMETLAETGLMGLIPLFVLVFMGLVQFHRARHYAIETQCFSQANLIMHVGIALFTISLFLFFLTGLNNKLFWLFLGLGHAFLLQHPLSSEKAHNAVQRDHSLSE